MEESHANGQQGDKITFTSQAPSAHMRFETQHAHNQYTIYIVYKSGSDFSIDFAFL